MQRLRVLTGHVRPGADAAPAAAAAPPAARTAAGDVALSVGFDGATFRPVAPLSRPGRGAYAGQEESRDVDHYLRCRRAAETGSSKLWRIHGKLYDLAPYMDKHPGGRTWLELTRGTDATEAFEAHHLDGAKAERALRPFYVRDVRDGEFPCGDRFTYADDGFFRTLRRRVLARLKEDAGAAATTQDATAATPAMRAACVAVVVQFAALHVAARTTGSWAAAALVGMLEQSVWGVGHNFMHQSDRKGWPWSHGVDAIAMPMREFQVTHALSHHMHPNLRNDWETCWYLSDGQYSYTNEENPIGKMLPFLPALAPLNVIRSAVDAARAAVSDPVKALALAVPLLHLVSYARGRGSWREAAALLAVQSAARPLFSMPFGLGPHHSVAGFRGEGEEVRKGAAPRDTFAWREGQPGGVADFGAHQVAATTDQSVYAKRLPAFLDHWLSLTLFGYLNDHVLHHLFPSVDHSKFRVIREVFEETAKEFGLDYKVRSPQGVAVGFVQWMRSRVVHRRAAL